jgi:hypothetical protein
MVKSLHDRYADNAELAPRSPGTEPPLDYGHPETAIEFRGFVIRREPKYFLWQVSEVLDGGPVPRKLTGSWTNLELIKSSISKYLDDVPSRRQTMDKRQ